jgi:hypothetical protein
MRIGRVGLTLIGALMMLSGCGVGHTGAQPTSATLPPARYVGAIAEPILYTGVVLEPPATTQVGVSWTQAYANCLTGDAICDAGAGPTISLARATVSGVGEALPDGSIDLLLNERLVYVLTWTGVPCLPVGPAARRPVPTALPCTVLNFVDANTGAVVHSIQGPSL